ncbi:MAG: HAD-IA family hydrolase [Planctomycetota bacterium]
MTQSKILNQKSTIDLVVFDLGRVLLRISDDWDHAAALAGRPGLAGLTGDLSTAEARGTHHPLAGLLDRYETGRVMPDVFFAEGERLSGHAAADLRAVMDAVLIEAFPGAAELIERLADRPVRTACLSNTNAGHWDAMHDPGHRAYLPLHRLDFPWASQLFGLAKPDPAIYARCEQDADVLPGAVLFFDDLPENVAAAADRGWRAELVPRDLDNPVPLIQERLASYGLT